MSERTIIITESEGAYSVQNDSHSEFELIGILECITFELKSARQHKASGKTTGSPDATQETQKHSEEIAPEPKTIEKLKVIPTATDKETIQSTASSELRTRISNAVKAIKNLGGEVGDINRNGATDEELQTELDELTQQYKRLKNSKGK